MILPSHSISVSEYKEFDNCITRLIDIDAIQIHKPDGDNFLSPIFLVPKSNGDKRFILNLKQLNKFVETHHFKMEDYRTVTKLMTRGCYMASIDLKDAYFLLPVHKSFRKYLCFQYRDCTYEFTCLPFGLCTAPYVFTKLLKPVMEHLRNKNILSVIFLDDYMCFGQSYSECEKNVRITLDLLQSLGFIINKEKSCLVPSTQCRYLGFVFNSV